MTLSRVFTTEDTTLYSTWERGEKEYCICLFVPGVGEVRMTLDKADEVAEELKRHAEYGRWHAIEERHNEKPIS